MIKTNYNSLKIFNNELPKVIRNQQLLIKRLRKLIRITAEEYNHYNEIFWPSLKKEQSELLGHLQKVGGRLKVHEKAFSRGLSELLAIDPNEEGEIIMIHGFNFNKLYVGAESAYTDNKFLDVMIRHGLKIPIYEG